MLENLSIHVTVIFTVTIFITVWLLLLGIKRRRKDRRVPLLVIFPFMWLPTIIVPIVFFLPRQSLTVSP
jgi:hypothetical protein